jgi:hypothetical protein
MEIIICMFTQRYVYLNEHIYIRRFKDKDKDIKKEVKKEKEMTPIKNSVFKFNREKHNSVDSLLNDVIANSVPLKG